MTPFSLRQIDRSAGGSALHRFLRRRRTGRRRHRRRRQWGEWADAAAAAGVVLRAQARNAKSPSLPFLQSLFKDFPCLMIFSQVVETVLEKTKKKCPSFPRLTPRFWLWGVHRQRFKTMAILVDTAKGGGLKGGALASAIHAHSRHGDPDVRQFVHRCDEYLWRLRFGFLLGVPLFQA